MTDGFALVDKPPGMTSHDVVAQARRSLGIRKVGHSGTLDPDATGLLVLGVGRATRLLRFVTELPKTYETDLVLGVETDTLDASGVETARHDMAGVGLDQLRSAAESFIGPIDQIPPMVSAVRVGGQRLHELARQGKEVEREARRVTIHRLEVAPTGDPSVFHLEVTCSSGTYVRTLGADLAAAVGGGAHIRDLRRTASGSLSVDRASSLDELEVLAPNEVLVDLPGVVVHDDTARLVSHGRPLDRAELGLVGEGPWRLSDGSGRLLAVYEPDDEVWARPAVVLVSA